MSEAVTFAIYLLYAIIRRKGTNISEYVMLLDSSFGYSEENSIFINVSSVEEVVEISEKVSEFCAERGIDSRRTYFASLCTEELAGNVVSHGFEKDSKPHTCNIRVIAEDGGIILRIRDDCKYFNLKERFEVLDKSDRFKNIGIRLVMGIAKDIEYINLIGTNTLLIKF